MKRLGGELTEQISVTNCCCLFASWRQNENNNLSFPVTGTEGWKSVFKGKTGEINLSLDSLVFSPSILTVRKHFRLKEKFIQVKPMGSI